MKIVGFEMIEQIDEFLANYPDDLINRYHDEISMIKAAQYNFENKVSDYLDPIALLDYFNRVRQMNCLSTHVFNMIIAVNQMIECCSQSNENINFAREIDSYISEYISNWTMYIIYTSYNDERYKKKETHDIVKQYGRIVETANKINEELIERDINQRTKDKLKNNLVEIKGLAKALPESNATPQAPIDVSEAATSSNSSSGCIWGIIGLILIIVRLIFFLSD